jgi:hypothetical protein
MSGDVQQVRNERQSTYGPWRTNMAGTSAQISGLLAQMIENESASVGRCSRGEIAATLPDWFAPMVMVLVKANRIGSGVYHADNFTDLRAYLDMVEQMQRDEAR